MAAGGAPARGRATIRHRSFAPLEKPVSGLRALRLISIGAVCVCMTATKAKRRGESCKQALGLT